MQEGTLETPTPKAETEGERLTRGGAEGIEETGDEEGQEGTPKDE